MESINLIEELVKIGEQQSKMLAVDPANLEAIRNKANEIALERENLVALKNQLITKDEFANLILAHFQSTICNLAGISEPSDCPDYSVLFDKIVTLVS